MAEFKQVFRGAPGSQAIVDSGVVERSFLYHPQYLDNGDADLCIFSKCLGLGAGNHADNQSIDFRISSILAEMLLALD